MFHLVSNYTYLAVLSLYMLYVFKDVDNIRRFGPYDMEFSVTYHQQWGSLVAILLVSIVYSKVVYGCNVLNL
jgi:hypothetical protein